MPPQPPADRTGHLATADVTLRGGDFALQARLTVPAGPTPVAQLLPLARALADTVVQQASEASAAAGAPVSCTRGCGACCNNLVAVSEIEARRIAALVESLPEPRGADIRARFADACRRLHQAGLLDALQRAAQWTAADYRQLVERYFTQGIPCPFLDDGACSIYAERPITCREYLVTSAPALCALPGSAGVQLLRLPLRIFNAVARWQTPPPEHLMERVVPLVMALQWAADHPDEPPPQPGMELVRELLQHLNEPPDGT